MNEIGDDVPLSSIHDSTRFACSTKMFGSIKPSGSLWKEMFYYFVL